MMPRQLPSSLAPPRWHSSMTMKSKKSGGYSPKYGEGWPSFGGPLMKVWKMVKNRLAFFGTLPFLRMSSGLIRTMASSGNEEKLLFRLAAHSPTRGTRVVPALCRVRVEWESVLLDPQPSLLTLRRRCPVFVRMIHRYYAAV